MRNNWLREISCNNWNRNKSRASTKSSLNHHSESFETGTWMIPKWSPQWSQKSQFWKKNFEMPGGITFSYIHMYHKWRLYDHSLHFPPPNNPENQKFKTEKTHGDIIILHICTINDNNMMYGSWDMEHEGQDFLSF